MKRTLLVFALIAGVSLTSANALASRVSACRNSGQIRTYQKQKQICQKAGKRLVWVATKNVVTTTSTLPVPVNAPTMPAGGDDQTACMLREARTKKYQPWNVGFPRGDSYGTSMLPTSGRVNVQLLAIEFPDALGTAAELTAADAQISEFNKWFEFTSNGALSFNWQFPKQWFRMSRAVPNYGLQKGDNVSNTVMAQEVISIADQEVNFSGSHFVFVLFPKSIRLGTDSLAIVNGRVETNEGPVKNVFGGADYFYNNDYDLWSFWVHEWGHPMGLAGHTPRSNISVMDNQNGSSVMLNVWDTFFTGWMGSNELYCMPIEEKSKEITLIPLERLQRGPRGVIVPISDTNAVVIESHRAEGWGKRMLDSEYGRKFGVTSTASYGVSVYWIDTTMDTNRYAGSSGFTDTDAGDRWADNLVPSGVSRPFDLLISGDKVSYRGVTVEFVKTGVYDTVRITK